MGLYSLILILAIGLGIVIDFAHRKESGKPFWELWIFIIPMLLVLGFAIAKGNINY